jgi:hypothetical protein
MEARETSTFATFRDTAAREYERMHGKSWDVNPSWIDGAMWAHKKDADEIERLRGENERLRRMFPEGYLQQIGFDND